MKVTAWKAWYRGGRAYCSSGTNPDELPTDEMLAIMVVFDADNGAGDPIRRTVSGGDWYWYVKILGEPVWCQGQREQYRDAESIRARYPGAVVIEGVWTNDEEMQQVNAEMAIWKG